MMDDMERVKVFKASALVLTATVMASVLWFGKLERRQTWREPSYIHLSEFDCARDHSKCVTVLCHSLAHSLNVDL